MPPSIMSSSLRCGVGVAHAALDVHHPLLHGAGVVLIDVAEVAGVAHAAAPGLDHGDAGDEAGQGGGAAAAAQGCLGLFIAAKEELEAAVAGFAVVLVYRHGTAPWSEGGAFILADGGHSNDSSVVRLQMSSVTALVTWETRRTWPSRSIRTATRSMRQWDVTQCSWT